LQGVLDKTVINFLWFSPQIKLNATIEAKYCLKFPNHFYDSGKASTAQPLSPDLNVKHDKTSNRQTVYGLAPYCCVSSVEETSTKFIVFGLILPGLQPTIYRPQGEHANHNTIEVVRKL
jgi:hypothetical protein